MSDLAFTPAVEQARLIRSRQVSPVELTELYLERIERLDPQLNSFVTVAAESARAAARAAEAALAQPDLPPFHGVPISLKDLDVTAGIRTTMSCRPFADWVPDFDSAMVGRLRRAGFTFLGKTNTPEFGSRSVTESELNGACRNPWDTSRNAGGSSGGAAAALAAGLCGISQGSDGGGSIRIPASCCGVFGLKPSRGRISGAPTFGSIIEGFATSGPITRTVRDAAALLDVQAGYEVGDPYWAAPPSRPFAEEVGRTPGKLRVGIAYAPPFESPVDPLCVEAARAAGHLLESLGHHVEEATPDWHEPDYLELFGTIWAGSSAYFGMAPRDAVEPLNRALGERADATSATTYVTTVQRMHRLARRIVAFWNDYDLLLTPGLAMPPVPVGWALEPDDVWEQFDRGWAFTPFTQVANLTGQPAASLPLHWSAEGLPIGVQLVGRPAGDAELIRVCAQIEAAQPWAGRRPPVS
jgi:amidase